MMIQAAFTGGKKFLKGGLHCHTTRSDGKGDPADVMRIYADKNYDFLAITDHRRYNFENFAPETGLTIIPGMEMDRDITTDAGMCFHIVSIGPEKGKGNGFEHEQRFERGLVADQYEMQPVIDMLHENGNMTIYCHPDWSCTPARSYENMKGNFAMEIWNTGCVFENDMDKDALGWDELLTAGRKIYGVATDDGHAMDQHGHGWVMVNAENSVDAILAALAKGAFYSSTGPEIYDFRIEGDRAIVECSPCKFVNFINGTRPNRMVTGEGPVTRAEIKIPDATKYLRVTMMDEAGHRAWSNPIFFDER